MPSLFAIHAVGELVLLALDYWVRPVGSISNDPLEDLAALRPPFGRETPPSLWG